MERAHGCGAPVIYVQHSDERSLVKDTPGWQLHPGLLPLAGEPIVQKLHGNAFEETDLSDLLNARKVGRIVVCGLVTHGCVKSTCLGGLALGYPVTLATDAHSNFNADALHIIEKWHANLDNAGVTLLPTGAVRFK